LKRHLYIILGFVFVALGFIGILLPVWPTTPFLLLSAWFFARSSDRWYRWLLNSRVLGDYIRHYREGCGVPLRKKVIMIAFLWVSLILTGIFLLEAWWGRALLLAVAVGVTIHISCIKPAAKA
jgi:uncharacterized membrane protein YbaN (DUF454 family)